MANRRVVSPIFRVSFPAVFEAKAFDGGEPKFSLAMLWKADAKLDDLKKLVDEAAQEFFKGKIPANMKRPLRDGMEKDGVDGYGKGIIFASASSKQAPGIINLDNTRIVSPQEFYAGCYARATLTAYGYDQKGNKGVPSDPATTTS